MSNSDFIELAASYAYATVLLVVGELLRRLFGQKPELTRKIIHIGAGMWVFGVLLLFDRWESGILPNASVYRTQLPVLPVPALRRNGRRRQLTRYGL